MHAHTHTHTSRIYMMIRRTITHIQQPSIVRNCVHLVLFVCTRLHLDRRDRQYIYKHVHIENVANHRVDGLMPYCELHMLDDVGSR